MEITTSTCLLQSDVRKNASLSVVGRQTIGFYCGRRPMEYRSVVPGWCLTPDHRLHRRIEKSKHYRAGTPQSNTVRALTNNLTFHLLKTVEIIEVMSAVVDPIQELLAKGFVVEDKLSHSEIIPFVQVNLKKRTASTVVFVMANLLVVAAIVYNMTIVPIAIDAALSKFSLGMVCAFALIPIHEMIHGAVYYLVGAREVKYEANFRKFVFYAMADKFVANARQFALVAIAPFAVITTTLVVTCFFVSPANSFVVLGALLVHTGACSGDFGLMSYFDSNKEYEVVTIDDRDAATSYFLIRENS